MAGAGEVGGNQEDPAASTLYILTLLSEFFSRLNADGEMPGFLRNKGHQTL